MNVPDLSSHLSEVRQLCETPHPGCRCAPTGAKLLPALPGCDSPTLKAWPEISQGWSERSEPTPGLKSTQNRTP